MSSRVTVGSLLGNAVLLAYLLEPSPTVLYYLIFLPLFYDLIYMASSRPYHYLLIFIFFYGAICNLAIVDLYVHDKFTLIQYVGIVTMSDVFQYLAGRYLGRTQLAWPSPSKTLEGYLGGIVATVLVITCISQIPYYLTLRLVLNGIVGDSIESVCKRRLNLKDSSDLLGPHGGWLDRVDGIFFALLVEYLLLP
jgi:phosphatidate cytidylyltransferase